MVAQSQLRLQSSHGAHRTASGFDREWRDELSNHARLEILLALRGGVDPGPIPVEG